MSRPLRAFVSATTRGLGTAPDRHHVTRRTRTKAGVQDDFEGQPDYVTIARLIRYGAKPRYIPEGEAWRAYTQFTKCLI